jgi:hypothetical protein
MAGNTLVTLFGTNLDVHLTRVLLGDVAVSIQSQSSSQVRKT